MNSCLAWERRERQLSLNSRQDGWEERTKRERRPSVEPFEGLLGRRPRHVARQARQQSVGERRRVSCHRRRRAGEERAYGDEEGGDAGCRAEGEAEFVALWTDDKLPSVDFLVVYVEQTAAICSPEKLLAHFDGSKLG